MHGTPLSQLLPYLYVHSDAELAKRSILTLIDILTKEKGFPSRRLLISKLKGLMANGDFPGLMYSLSDLHL